MDFAPMSLAPMSPLGMFFYAGPVSKLVMALLLAAAVWTWVLIIDGVFVLLRLSKALDRVRAGGDIGVLWPIAEAAREASQAELPNETIHQKRERILQQMNRAAREFMLDAEGGLPVLAIVASAGPFVGLFGTLCRVSRASRRLKTRVLRSSPLASRMRSPRRPMGSPRRFRPRSAITAWAWRLAVSKRE